MSPVVAAIGVAALVSLVVSVFTLWIAVRRDRGERRKSRRELQVRLTERLYDLRVRHYPEAFAITQAIHGGVLLNKQLTPDDLREVREALSAWSAGEVSFVLSRGSLDAYYLLRDALAVAPEEEEGYSKVQQEGIWRAKNAFRERLRRDVRWLFRDDEQPERKKRRSRSTTS